MERSKPAFPPSQFEAVRIAIGKHGDGEIPQNWQIAQWLARYGFTAVIRAIEILAEREQLTVATIETWLYRDIRRELGRARHRSAS